MKKLKVTRLGSLIRKEKRQKKTMEALGLRKRHQVKIYNDCPQIRGMLAQVVHLVQIEEIDE